MQIKSPTTGVTEFRDLKIQKPVSHILFVKTGDAAITDEKITLMLQGETGSQKVISLSKIRRSAVISQFGQGHQLIAKLGDGSFKSAFLIALSDFGAIALGNNTYLQLDLTDLDVDSTYSVFGVESPIVARSYNEYNTESIVGNDPQSKVFTPSANLKGIALSNNDSLSSIRLSYAGGNEVTFTPEELDAIMRSANDISFAADSLIEGDSVNQTILGGGTELWWLNMDNCTRFEVTTKGGNELTVIQIVRKGF